MVTKMPAPERFHVCDYPPGCQCGNYELRRRTCVNGSVQYVHECLVCGRRGQCIPRPLVPTNYAFRDCDDSIAAQASRQRTMAALRRMEEQRETQEEADRTWRAKYEAHLLSGRWRSLRQRVLQRCGGTCEGCGDQPATEVHHLTYAHLGDELLFELVGICRDCHAKANNKA